VRPDTQQWWQQAEADLRVADAVLVHGEFFATSMFGHQAVEKALKALYLEQQGQLPPRTHDLGFLGSEVGAPSAVQADLLVVFPAFGMSRYPDNTGTAPVNLITELLARNHLEAARRIPAWIDAQL
jgi:HEPN domain-containing protein